MYNYITSLFKQSNSTVQRGRSGIYDYIATESILPFVGYIITFIMCYSYVFLMGNGLRAVYGDTWIYADMAKRIAFNHSLRMDCVCDLIYPPLYSVLISFAYLFHNQAAIFEAIKTINILVYASAFVPMYYLLRRYALLSINQSFAGAILLLINTYALGYVFYITAEPLYFPLMVWLAWFIADAKHLKSRFNVLMFVFVFLSVPLTKALGNLVFPSFVGATIVRYIYNRLNYSQENNRLLIRRSVFVVIISLIVIILYNIYLRFVMPATQTDVSGGYLQFLNHPNIIRPSYWLDRTVFSCSWMLVATGTVAVPLIISIIIRNPRIVYKDFLVSFFVFALLSTFVLVPLFTPTDFMGDPHQRYYDPLLFLFILILFKYIRLFALRDLLIAGGTVLILCVIAPPFPLFIIADHITSVISNIWVVYACIYVAAGAALIFMLLLLYKHKKYCVNLFLIMMVISMPMLFYLKSNLLGPNIFSFYDTEGIVEKVLSNSALHEKRGLVVDKSWRRSGFWMEYNQIMIDIPMVPVFKDVRSLAISANKGKKFLVLSHNKILNAAILAKGRNVSLFAIDL